MLQAAREPAAICCTHPSLAASRLHVAAAVDRQDGHLYCYTDPVPHIMQEASVSVKDAGAKAILTRQLTTSRSLHTVWFSQCTSVINSCAIIQRQSIFLITRFSTRRTVYTGRKQLVSCSKMCCFIIENLKLVSGRCDCFIQHCSCQRWHWNTHERWEGPSYWLKYKLGSNFHWSELLSLWQQNTNTPANKHITATFSSSLTT